MPSTAHESFDHWREHCLDDASADERAALLWWTTSSHRIVQKQLRAGRLTPEIAEKVSTIDRVLERHPLPETRELHRADSLARFGLKIVSDAEAIVGAQFDISGYLALTTKGRGIKTYPESIVRVHLTVPAGTPAAHLGSLPTERRQREVLTVRGNSFTVTNVDVDEEGALSVWAELQFWHE
ncbi:MAG: hypothetical protein LKI24_10635 [Acidipropionibacterium sp.]|jgi:predicted amidohydrolase YtcJ|nr:hypothetical protein [Acidipropionibacterium sp.]